MECDYLCGCKTFFIHDYKSYVLAYIYVICVYLANTLISYSHIFWESKSALVRLLLLYWCCSSIFFLDKQLCQMRNHVHILACKIHIDIITYILNKYLVFFLVYKILKRVWPLANIELILWKYFLSENIRCCKLKSTNKTNRTFCTTYFFLQLILSLLCYNILQITAIRVRRRYVCTTK